MTPSKTYPRLHLFPTDLYLLMAPDPSSEGWDKKEGRPLPSQPVAYSASCLGNPSDPCRARVKMTQRQGIQRMLPKDCPEGLWEEEPPRRSPTAASANKMAAALREPHTSPCSVSTLPTCSCSCFHLESG